ncbi:hypothetical protein VULLAG_LOCUS6349 [Vulpes lagopus]
MLTHKSGCSLFSTEDLADPPRFVSSWKPASLRNTAEREGERYQLGSAPWWCDTVCTAHLPARNLILNLILKSPVVALQ